MFDITSESSVDLARILIVPTVPSHSGEISILSSSKSTHPNCDSLFTSYLTACIAFTGDTFADK